jgi:hypothetical protein
MKPQKPTIQVEEAPFSLLKACCNRPPVSLHTLFGQSLIAQELFRWPSCWEPVQLSEQRLPFGRHNDVEARKAGFLCDPESRFVAEGMQLGASVDHVTPRDLIPLR